MCLSARIILFPTRWLKKRLVVLFIYLKLKSGSRVCGQPHLARWSTASKVLEPSLALVSQNSVLYVCWGKQGQNGGRIDGMRGDEMQGGNKIRVSISVTMASFSP